MTVKIGRDGKIRIPKELQNHYNLTEGISMTLTYYDDKLVLRPENICPNCKKALPGEDKARNVCPYCSAQMNVITIY